jgi:uncharacterized protein YjbI with pentapeptide repeats
MPKSLTMENSADNDNVVVQGEEYVDCIAEGARFDCAQLTAVKFVRCDLYWASFFMARLTDVTFDHCDLRGSDFKDAKMNNCRFVNCDVGTDALGGETSFDGTNLDTVRFMNCRGAETSRPS